MTEVTEILRSEVERLEKIEKNYRELCNLITSPVVSTGQNYHDVASRLNDAIKLIKSS